MRRWYLREGVLRFFRPIGINFSQWRTYEERRLFGKLFVFGKSGTYGAFYYRYMCTVKNMQSKTVKIVTHPFSSKGESNLSL